MNSAVLNLCASVMQEINDSIVKHGDWSDYTFEEMHRAENGERQEVADAVANFDITGRHGLISETKQVAATLLKRVLQYEARMKLFCEDGHEWFGECLPAVCPRCHKPAIGAKQ